MPVRRSIPPAAPRAGRRDDKSQTETRAQRKARILEEAQALCRVEHPNIVRFYALAVDDDRGLIALAME